MKTSESVPPPMRSHSSRFHLNPSHKVMHPEECAQMCRNNPRCSSFEYSPTARLWDPIRNRPRDDKGTCRLSSRAAGLLPCRGFGLVVSPVPEILFCSARGGLENMVLTNPLKASEMCAMCSLHESEYLALWAAYEHLVWVSCIR